MGLALSKQPATLKHLNIRKDGPDDDHVVAVDIKLTTTVDARELQPLVGDSPSLVIALWLADQSPAFWAIRELRFSTEFERHRLKLGSATFQGVTLKRFVVEPRDGAQADVTFTAQVHPHSRAISTLAEYVGESIDCTVECDELPLEGGGRDTPAVTVEAPEVETNDPFLPQARALVQEAGRASPSYLQRHLSIGWNRACRLIEALEGLGIVGPRGADGERLVKTKEPV